MTTIQVYLKDEVFARLAYLALQKGKSVTALVQEAVALLLESAEAEEAKKQ